MHTPMTEAELTAARVRMLRLGRAAPGFFISSAFVIPFMILKTIIDLGSLRPEALKRRFLV